MSKEKTTRKEPVETQGPQAPAGWRHELAAESDVRDALRRCEAAGIDLSGSRYEKASREARRLDLQVYRLGGSEDGDKRQLAALACRLSELQARLGVVQAQGGPTRELDAAISTVEANIRTIQDRVQLAAVGEDQVTRWNEVQRLRQEEVDLRQQIAPFNKADMPTPPELENRLDAVVVELDAAEAGFEAGAAELTKLCDAKGKAEREARHGLGTTLRQHLCEKIAEAVREAMPREKLILYGRRPERGLPAGIEALLGQAEVACALADRLADSSEGLEPFARLLGEAHRTVLFPSQVMFAAISDDGDSLSQDQLRGQAF